MNLQTLLAKYSDDNRLKQLAAGIVLPSPHIQVNLSGLKGTSIGMVAATVWSLTRSNTFETGCNHVFVLNDREEAAYFHNDLEHLTKGMDICYFPDSYKKPGVFNMLNSSHIMLRTEALSKISKERSGAVLVTYPEAIFEKVITSNRLKERTISIHVAQNLDVNLLVDKLIDIGFKKEEFVYEPGQFAIRGGIFDIYSFGNDRPYRIELFGREVDSIRIFDPETQLSERKLTRVDILPNVDGVYDEQKISLMDYLPENTTFWFKDKSLTIAKLEHLSSVIYEKVQNNEISVADPEDQALRNISLEEFESPAYFKEILAQNHIITWENSNLEVRKKQSIYGSDDAATQYTVNLTFDTQHQPVFNRNFELLISDLSQLKLQGYEIYIFAENSKQLERLHAIFSDLNAAFSFIPIPIPISQGFIDHEKKIAAYTDHQIFQRYHKYKIKQAYSKGKALTIKALRELQPGDYVTHIDHGVGKYSGLQKIEVNGVMQEAIRIIYKDNDILYVNINSLHKISKFTGKEGTIPKVHKLGSGAWDKLKEKTKRKVKDIAANLIKLYAKRKVTEGFVHSADNYLQTELEASFVYEDTPDQSKATEDVKKDMQSPYPMDRLICGDVGFGKTEIAMRAVFKTVCDNKQAAILVPTTILAYQHYQTFKKRLKDFPCNVDYINRFKTSKEKKETLQKLKSGEIDIIIGTHALLGKDVKFKDLGLLVVDEEQKFGVAAKEKLRERKVNVDTLTLTATPIPRTLQFSLMSARDMSIINTAPPNRQPIHTELIGFNEELIRDAIYYETLRGGQVYFIHNRVQSLPTIATQIRKLCPDLNVVIAHGQMDGKELEMKLLDFINRKVDVMCCTNIVESGVDISNANTIIINNAHQFGLSDLHQLRGRVGRSNKKAFCYLVTPSLITLPSDSRKRLQTLEQFSDLGSGFQIAMRDLDIRGAGDMLGGEQSGFINDIGFEMYQKILSEAIKELKSSEFKDLFAEELQHQKDYVMDCVIDTDQEILIPDDYIENTTERLSLYTQLDHIEDLKALTEFENELIDRFGPIPKQVKALITTVKVRKIAKELGFEKIILKQEKLLLYFISNPESPYYDSTLFQDILRYIQTRLLHATIKQRGKHYYVSINNIKNMLAVWTLLEDMNQYTNSKAAYNQV